MAACQPPRVTGPDWRQRTTRFVEPFEVFQGGPTGRRRRSRSGAGFARNRSTPSRRPGRPHRLPGDPVDRLTCHPHHPCGIGDQSRAEVATPTRTELGPTHREAPPDARAGLELRGGCCPGEEPRADSSVRGETREWRPSWELLSTCAIAAGIGSARTFGRATDLPCTADGSVPFCSAPHGSRDGQSAAGHGACTATGNGSETPHRR